MKKWSWLVPIDRFVAIDFETANPRSISACAVGIVRIERGEKVAERVRLIRPPTSQFDFTAIHGITWDQVKDSPTFAEVWQECADLFEGIEWMCAHNAGFDAKVMQSCTRHYGLPEPQFKKVCTVNVARGVLGIYPTKLSDVCRRLGIELNHHEALSDARASARILIEAQERLRSSHEVQFDLWK